MIGVLHNIGSNFTHLKVVVVLTRALVCSCWLPLHEKLCICKYNVLILMIGEEEEQMYHCWASWYSGIWHACAFISLQCFFNYRLPIVKHSNDIIFFLNSNIITYIHVHNESSSFHSDHLGRFQWVLIRLKFNLLTFITDEGADMFHMHNLREKSYD